MHINHHNNKILGYNNRLLTIYNNEQYKFFGKVITLVANVLVLGFCRRWLQKSSNLESFEVSDDALFSDITKALVRRSTEALCSVCSLSISRFLCITSSFVGLLEPGIGITLNGPEGMYCFI